MTSSGVGQATVFLSIRSVTDTQNVLMEVTKRTVQLVCTVLLNDLLLGSWLMGQLANGPIGTGFASQKCNRHPECPDGSDEEDCPVGMYRPAK